ncbi:FadR/GntR family transcriptional regulator [Marinilabilia salmonicolor]|jgi:DNA-binding FadR family transcriptional regulator|uniref:DNA-binding FadR family transcriptional regulator n=1 Tax=Marinilabilia salmonicolor TaxID=989 RepID=A0A2T0XRQ1_9BACT|nr:GntR family transcriptional regulator [Marinilabilia salmonicolor]PRZ01619.1 DNA-binding FadR family transcriptional regulator [Marinilabilia salmonicolor]RCW31560.1 DNA-binding FadR family transcriptional regulator [Marinilabilia salmonicolor]
MKGFDNELGRVDTRSLVDKVEMTLIDYLIRKKLKPGDRIPKEIELVEVLGVSRTVVRESLNRLKTIGLIESVKHRGAVIKSPDLLEVLKKAIIPGVMDSSTLRDIFELRLVLEIGMGDLIFKRKKPEDIRELHKIVENEPDSSENVLFEIDHEIKFHSKLYQITGNQTMMNFQTLLLPVFSYVYDSKLIERPIEKKNYMSHKQLVEILEYGNGEKFREAMRMHLENHFQRLFGTDSVSS